MEKIDAKVLGMVGVTLLTRLTAQLERQGALPLGWTAKQLREAAVTADNNIKNGTDPMLHASFATALRRVAELSLQALADDDDEAPLDDEKEAPAGDEDEAA